MKVKRVKGASRLEEARRRARILDRYNSIERPTADDDDAAAAELGLSTDRMIRLATVWRRYRDETLLGGHVGAPEGGGSATSAEVMAQDIDLEGVRPDRRAEILRRIRILQRHIAAMERGTQDVTASAKEVGVSAERFGVLLKIWKTHARAEALPGATRRGSPKRRQPSRARRLDLLRSCLEDAEPGTSVRAVYDSFSAACLREDLKLLSLKRFYAIAQDLRSTRAAG